MNRLLILFAIALLPVPGSVIGAAPARVPNLFSDWLQKTPEESAAKLEAAWQHFFGGDPGSQRLYYESGGEMAYIHDVGSDDVRSEGMSYGMMIAVQMDRKAVFDRLWKWAKTHMQHEQGPYAGYFAWHCTTEGEQLDPGPASDGEEWFAMALFFASGRWGNGTGIFDYEAEANAILEAMLREDRPGGHIISMFDREEAIIRFVPNQDYRKVTDPSYHLPAFYELWARWAGDHREFWSKAARTSRRFFRKTAHPETGLMPDYAHFDGRPYVQDGHEDFRFDAWRILQNVGLDHAWWGKDPWQVEQSNRILRFFQPYGDRLPNQFTLDGKPLDTDHSPGLYSMAAVAALAADRDVGHPFVERLWNLAPPEGKWRYYDGLLYYLALLQVSGEFRVYAPSSSNP